MCYELYRIAQAVAVAAIILYVHGVGTVLATTISPPQLQQLQQLKESLHGSMEVVDEVQLLVKQNFLYGIAGLGAAYENNTQCGQELEIMLNAIAKREVWALKVFDSFGSAPKSFLWGNYFWFGTPDLCDDLHEPYAIRLSHSTPIIFNASSPFPVKFVVIYLNFTTPYYVDLKLPFDNLIHLGLCMPHSCSISEIKTYTDVYFQHEHFQMQRNFKLEMKALHAKAPHFSLQYFDDIGSILVITIFIAIVLLGIIAEISYNSISKTNHNNNNTINSTSAQYNPQKPSTWQELLMCFHFSRNYKTVISLENSNSSTQYFSAMAGLRTIVCLWIAVFHVYYYSLFAMSNTVLIFAKLEHFALQPVQQAVFYVDVFFVMSSFLLVNNFLSNERQIKKIQCLSSWGTMKLLFHSIMQRYMRLTPVLIITMLLSAAVVDFLNMHSPFHLGPNSGFYCKTNWWYNLLYIQNFLDMNYICCSWTWYLACEMQYFILFTTLLYLYAKKPTAAKIVFVTLALGFVVIGWMCYFARGITFEIDVINSTLNQLYITPWTRIQPYLGGAIMGWLMHTLQQREHKTHLERIVTAQLSSGQQTEQYESGKVQTHHTHHQHDNKYPVQRKYVHTLHRKAFWIVCLVLYVATNFMSYWRSTPSWAVATIMSVGKLLFALTVGGVIIQCAYGRGGWLNAFLSARPFLILNKFCFSIYMVAPVLIMAMFGLRNEPTNFTEVGSGADFFTLIILSIMSAFLMLILIELPMQRVAKVLLRGKNNK